jgi:hypothetical protein
MAAFGIPPPYRESLTKLAGLPDADAERLIQEIGALAPFSPVSAIEEATSSVLGEGATPAERRLALPLLALRGQLRQMTTDAIAENLSESTDLDLDEAARSNLRSRAAAILEAQVFGTTGVATDLQTLHERNYQSARIVTDIRPVFQDDLAKAPDGAVIVETLQIQTWSRDGGAQLMFVSMDEADLRQLQSIVTRALDKTETLKAFIAEKGLSYFELEKEAVEG